MNKEKLKEFIAFLSARTSVKSEELLEKDFYINLLLHKLKDSEYAFKGGTCLSKVYLNYHRISEDIDLTFTKQEIFKGKTTKQVKKICSGKITDFGARIAGLQTPLFFCLPRIRKGFFCRPKQDVADLREQNP